MRCAMNSDTITSTTPMVMEPMASKARLPVSSVSPRKDEREPEANQCRDVLAEDDHQLGVARVLQPLEQAAAARAAR